MSDPLIARHRSTILRVASEHGAVNVCLFGSRARGEGGAESDVDLLIDLEQGRTLLDLVAIGQDLEDVLGRRVDVVTRNGLSPFLRDRILAEAVPL